MVNQVNKSHYNFGQYIDKRRWASIWHQLDELSKLQPTNVLEIGPGPSILKATARALNIDLRTLDTDPELSPDYTGDILSLPFGGKAFDVVCAFQVLEHLPFPQSLKGLKEMSRVAARAVLLSLPDAARGWPYAVFIPFFGDFKFWLPRPIVGGKRHHFDGQHYWELNKKGYKLPHVMRAMEEVAQSSIQRTFRVPENPYHRFFVLTPTTRQTE